MLLGSVKSSGHCPCTEEPENKTQLYNTINLKPSGVHVIEFILKVRVLVLIENTTEQDSDPMCAHVPFSCRVPDPTKS